MLVIIVAIFAFQGGSVLILGFKIKTTQRNASYSFLRTLRLFGDLLVQLVSLLGVTVD